MAVLFIDFAKPLEDDHVVIAGYAFFVRWAQDGMAFAHSGVKVRGKGTERGKID